MSTSPGEPPCDASRGGCVCSCCRPLARGLRNLVGEVEPELPVLMVASQAAGSQAFARIAEYLPRYSKDCRAVADPFKTRRQSFADRKKRL
ncbi:MAG: hypothetical protein PHO07_15160 [Pirellulales bacterium]|nr:hypothetical protein [Thermoguttaceae bacterium]MDD4788513.1 hypothetical protein [Pirellulales bacterium]NLZ01813.1 hypothetical protein [Pirellulaceae bacterium]